MFGRFFVDYNYLFGADVNYLPGTYESCVLPSNSDIGKEQVFVRFNDQPYHTPALAVNYVLNASVSTTP